jgi:predicted phage terminase large subunit-like protein
MSYKRNQIEDNKEHRAEPYAVQVQAGNVLLLAEEWNRAFLDEHETFPSGKFKDQVDAASGAFTKVTAKSTYDTSLAWVG